MPDEFNPRPDGPVWSVAVHPADDPVEGNRGKVVFGGEFTSLNPPSAPDFFARTSLARVDQRTGAPDALDVKIGHVGVPSARPDVTNIAIDGDGRIIIGGGFTKVAGEPRQYLARLDATGSGSVDPNFVPSPVGFVYSLAVHPRADPVIANRGRILVGGQFSEIDGVPREGLARLNVDGSLDTNFRADTDGYAVYSTLIRDDGSIVVGGSFFTLAGLERRGLAQLGPGGALTEDLRVSVGPGSIGIGAVSSIVEQFDGALVIGGNFLLVDNIERKGVARLLPDQQGLSAPGTLVARTSKGKVVLRWQPPASGAGTVTSYQWRIQAPSQLSSDWKTVAKGARGLKQVVKRIRPRQVYVFEVRAMAGRLASPAATVSVRGR